MTSKSLRLVAWLVTLGAAFVALTVNRCNAAATYLVRIQTTGLSPGSFNTLDFHFNDGGDGSNNVASISHLNFGSATPLESTSDFSLVDAYPDTQTIDFLAGGNIVTFFLTLTTNPNLNTAQADSFFLNLYDGAGNPFNSQTKPLLEIDEPTVENGFPNVQVFNSGGLTVTVVPATNFISYSGDFNADGKQDVLWRNTLSGEVRLWYMNGQNVLANDSVATVGLDWEIVGIADFDGTGFSDILWQNVNDGSFAIWTMRGDSATSHQYPSPGSQWSITGVADLDHNGLADILWRNIVTGEVNVWRSLSPLNFSSQSIGVASLDWNLIGTADLFGDGHPELIWRNQNSGEVRAWQLSGNTIIANASLGFAPLNWQIVGFGNFTGSRRQDILWRNTADGSVDAWIMNGFTIVTQLFPGAVSLDWQIRATPDVNGNGINSIFWSNVSTGQQVIWTANGSTFVSGGPFAFAAPEWVVQPEVNVGNLTPQ
jgi:hypothetical protein